MYLDVKVVQNNGVGGWKMVRIKYVCKAVRNCEAQLVANVSGRFTLPKKADSSFQMGLNIKHGRINIITRVSLLS